ncbi:MAG: tetratricopeptide repeat protein, partial [Bdellovibrionota bacterium]
GEGLKNSIHRAVNLKLHPSEYIKTIEVGKTVLVSGKIDEAIQAFNRAVNLSEKPSLAHFYLARANLNKKSLTSAQNHFFEGLRHNQLHYKCLVGLYDVLIAKHRHEEAYQVVKRIAKYFPANPERVSAIFRLAVLTQNFEDIENYYKIFTSIDDRSEDMIRHVSSALVVAGKYFLRKSDIETATRHFQYAVTTAPRRPTVLREIIMSLIERGLVDDARAFFKKTPQDSRYQTNSLAMEYVIRNQLDSTSQIIDSGRDLIAKGFHDPAIYNILIRRSIEAGLIPSAEDLIYKASQLWPQQSETFAELMEVPNDSQTETPTL